MSLSAVILRAKRNVFANNEVCQMPQKDRTLISGAEHRNIDTETKQ